ncbi:MAG: sarcosine oxidase subunit gamma family protein [Solirubrobacteraceae bacterium]
MSALAFLSISESAPARSPMPDSAAVTGFVDCSLLPKHELRGAHELELGTAVKTDDGSWRCPITPIRTLILGPNRTTLRNPNDHSVSERSLGLDVTCAYATIELVGPLSNELLARFCAIDVRSQVMPVGAFRPGSVARTPGFVLRTGEDSLLLLVGWAFGEYLWDVVADAAGRLYA